jgi:hypothetical protein
MTEHPGGLASRSCNPSCVHLTERKMRDLPGVEVERAQSWKTCRNTKTSPDAKPAQNIPANSEWEVVSTTLSNAAYKDNEYEAGPRKSLKSPQGVRQSLCMNGGRMVEVVTCSNPPAWH